MPRRRGYGTDCNSVHQMVDRPEITIPVVMESSSRDKCVTHEPRSRACLMLDCEHHFDPKHALSTSVSSCACFRTLTHGVFPAVPAQYLPWHPLAWLYNVPFMINPDEGVVMDLHFPGEALVQHP